MSVEGIANAMWIKYEDNYGFYDIDDNDSRRISIFCHMRAQSKPTLCVRCYEKVRLLGHIKYVQRVHKHLNSVNHQIQRGSPQVFGAKPFGFDQGPRIFVK